jgi:excinuclease UvrABC nuclease subunit
LKALVYRAPYVGGAVSSWLAELGAVSGAYVIRSKAGRVLYVGESHTGRLRKTVLRHFQAWRDSDPALKHWTYSAGAVEVAIRITPPASAVGCQNNLIARLGPRDNVEGRPAAKPPRARKRKRDDWNPF